MQGKTILVTGGNSGLGLHAAGQLAQKGAKVIITTRDEAKAKNAQAEIQKLYGQHVDYLLLDLGDLDSVRKCAAEFNAKYDRLDVLVNNAGLNVTDRRETKQGFEYVLGVNQVGPYLFTNLLLDKLKASTPSRIVCLSSAAHVGARKGIDWDDLQRHKKYGGQPYCQVKLGTIFWVQEMAKHYKDFGITAYAVNPRLVSTNFAMDGDTTGIQKIFFTLGKYWMLTPDKGCNTTVWCASEPGIENLSGQYFQDCAPRKPASWANNPTAAKRWWDLNETWMANGKP
jgi:NAD(P)-dependent dehydrogenase (short-subunit alcohol dehydrogenase family)